MADSPPDADAHDMARLAAGEDLALNAIMERWSGRIHAFLRRMTRDHESAEDLAQEVFVRLYRSRESYRPSAPFSAYLFRIASNLARNHARWRTRHPSVALEDAPAERQDPPSGAPGPDAQAAGAEHLRLVERSIGALPADLREAMLLFTHHDMGYADIARVMQCTVKAVETRIYRARQMLKDALRNLEG